MAGNAIADAKRRLARKGLHLPFVMMFSSEGGGRRDDFDRALFGWVELADVVEGRHAGRRGRNRQRWRRLVRRNGRDVPSGLRRRLSAAVERPRLVVFLG